MSSRSKIMLFVIVCMFLLAFPAMSQDTVTDSLKSLKELSDSARLVTGKALLDRDIPLLRTVMPDHLGIVLPGGVTLSGKDATTIYDSLLMATFGGAELITDRVSILKMKTEEEYVKELCSFELTRKTSDSTFQSWTGHFTNFWLRKDGEWSLQRLFITNR